MHTTTSSHAGHSPAQALAEKSVHDTYGNIERAEKTGLVYQTEMGVVQMTVKLAEALAKMLKSIGESLKSLS